MRDPRSPPAGSSRSGTAISAVSPRKSTRARSPSRWIGDGLEVVRLAEVARERVGDERAHRPGVGGDDGERVVRRPRGSPASSGGRRPPAARSRAAAWSATARSGRRRTTWTRAEARRGRPASRAAPRAACRALRVLAEHLGLLAHLAAGGDREVGEAALGARAVDRRRRRPELLGEHLGGHARAHARRVQQRSARRAPRPPARPPPRAPGRARGRTARGRPRSRHVSPWRRSRISGIRRRIAERSARGDAARCTASSRCGGARSRPSRSAAAGAT